MDLCQVTQRPLQIALALPGPAAIAVGEGIAGVEPDGLAVVGDGALVVLLVEPGDAPVVVGDGAVLLALAAVIEDARAGGDGAIRRRVLRAIVPLLLGGAQ